MSAGPHAATGDNHAVGVPLALAGILTLSTGGLFIRLIEEAGPWSVLFYRSIGFIAMIFLIVVVTHKGETLATFRRVGLRGAMMALVLGGGFLTYIFALVNVSVANAIFVIASAPVLAALLGWLFLKERIGAATWLTIGGSIAGISIMVAEGLSFGRFAGNLYALLTALSFAVMLVIARSVRTQNMLPATCLAGVVSLVVSALLVDDFAISVRDLTLCLTMGAFQIGIGFACLTNAPRYIPAAEVALIGLAETVLAPLWVWIGVGEVPTNATLLGGTVVVGFVMLYAVRNLLRERRRPSRP